MKAIQKDTYGSAKKKKTGYSVEQKTMNNSVQKKLLPQQQTPSPTVQREIQNKVVRPADRGRVETDPTQGWGRKLNAEISYNRLPNKQVMQKNGEYSKAYKSVMKKRKK